MLANWVGINFGLIYLSGISCQHYSQFLAAFYLSCINMFDLRLACLSDKYFFKSLPLNEHMQATFQIWLHHLVLKSMLNYEILGLQVLKGLSSHTHAKFSNGLTYNNIFANVCKSTEKVIFFVKRWREKKKEKKLWVRKRTKKKTFMWRESVRGGRGGVGNASYTSYFHLVLK